RKIAENRCPVKRKPVPREDGEHENALVFVGGQGRLRTFLFCTAREQRRRRRLCANAHEKRDELSDGIRPVRAGSGPENATPSSATRSTACCSRHRRRHCFEGSAVRAPR